MGILDKKTRFIDLVVTQEGKRQIAQGKLRAEFASFSDSNAFYDAGNKDVSKRLYFEVMERPENAIISEKDDSGRLINLNNTDDINTPSIVGNDIFMKGTDGIAKPVTGSEFQIGMQKVIDTALDHFKKNYFIGTIDGEGTSEFSTNKDKLTFTITDTKPFKNSPYKEIINVNDAEPFFLDSKMAHLDNFQFLPPVSHSTGLSIGKYKDIRSTTRESWEDIKKLVPEKEFVKDISPASSNNLLNPNIKNGQEYKSEKLFKNGKVPDIIEKVPRQVETLTFDKTSTENNLILQVYEDGLDATMHKLDVIDSGTFYDEDDKVGRTEKHVFYVGKVFYDDYKMPTFINIFTLIMD